MHPLIPYALALNPVRQVACQQVRAGNRWIKSQPATQWLAQEYTRAGQREYAARQALSDQLGRAWMHMLNAGHNGLTVVSHRLPGDNPVARPLKLVTAQWAGQLNRTSNRLNNKIFWRKLIGSFTFRGVYDSVFYLGGGKAALLAVHLVPGSPLTVLTPFALLAALSVGARLGPAINQAKSRFVLLDEAVLDQAQTTLLDLYQKTTALKQPPK